MQRDLKLDREKCAQRNRIAARRDGVNAERVKFLRDASSTAKVTATRGWLPESESEALERINALRPDQSAPELTADDVWVHYVEAANDNFIGDRYMFMGARTLQNIAADAERGFAFMNSHRTGGLSSDAELPFGRTFCGRYEVREGGDGPAQRAVIGFYMVRGVHPNGSGGPCTDDIHAAIDAGTIFDVSVGLWGGEYVCDVCGQDLYGRDAEGNYVCPHVPGSHRAMTAGQIAAQEARGVTKGRASYTLEDANCSETSAVYDGAVPGAGFNKALRFSRSMTATEQAEVRESFAALFGRMEETMAETKPGDPASVDGTPEGFMAALQRLFTSFFGPAQTHSQDTPPPEPTTAARETAGSRQAVVRHLPSPDSTPELTLWHCGGADIVAGVMHTAATSVADSNCAGCLRAELASHNAAAVAQREADARAAAERESNERNARIEAEVNSFMNEQGGKMGLDLRTAFDHFYRGAKTGAVSLRKAKAGVAPDAPDDERFEIVATATLSAEASTVIVGWLEEFARNLGAVGAEQRIAAGGPKIDAAARAAAGADPAPNAVHFEALKRLEAAGVGSGDPRFATEYEAKRAEILQEMGYGA